MSGSDSWISKFPASILIAAGLISLAGCTSVNSTARTFEGTSWLVMAINGQATPATDMYRITFAGGRIGGRFGCNMFGGPYRVEGEQLIAGELFSTRIGCTEPAATHESRGFAILGRPTAIDWTSGGQLTLRNAAGSIALERSR